MTTSRSLPRSWILSVVFRTTGRFKAFTAHSLRRPLV